MNRYDFHDFFQRKGPVILPVIHVLDDEQAERNVRTALDGGCRGVFLINHDFEREKLLPVIRHVRSKFPSLWLGVNFLATTGLDAFPILGDLVRGGTSVDAYWADDACIDERMASNTQPDAEEIDSVRNSSGWNGLYFGGTAFKKQRPVDPADYAKSAKIATSHMDVVTTSGIATGQSADLSKIATFRSACGDTALAVASGITPENAHEYAQSIDAFLVATGINHDGDFYNIDPKKLNKLMSVTE